ncbi:hypothetical protein M1146_06080 [Patescibacteria group bacterium]|nr:hypothetical protein [Patescibacteria group bacterium]
MKHLFKRAAESITAKHVETFRHQLDEATRSFSQTHQSSAHCRDTFLVTLQELRLDAQHVLEKELWKVWGQPATRDITLLIFESVKEIASVNLEEALSLHLENIGTISFFLPSFLFLPSPSFLPSFLPSLLNNC